jgi:peptidoglycan/xylan/chitin deacetylase (PgdA/CDA1 family)
VSILAVLLVTLWVPGTWESTPLTVPDLEEAPAGTTSGIPVLMYHHVSDPVNGFYGVSTSRFLADLAALDAAGFTLITPEDLENGLMQVPAGRRPLMLTLDDGWQDNFSFTGTSLDPDCAFALLEGYCDGHPDFGRGATFFISWDKVPFGQYDRIGTKLNTLLDMGYAIGNHSRRHASFSRLPRIQWEEAVVGAMERFHRHLGLRTSQVCTLSYPGGHFPDDPGSEELMASFTYLGVQAVQMGFLANGSVSSLGSLLEEPEGWYRIGRIDMSLYSVSQLLGWRNLMVRGDAREDLHDPLPWRMTPAVMDRLRP